MLAVKNGHIRVKEGGLKKKKKSHQKGSKKKEPLKGIR
jgi:hypothetical protein